MHGHNVEWLIRARLRASRRVHIAKQEWNHGGQHDSNDDERNRAKHPKMAPPSGCSSDGRRPLHLLRDDLTGTAEPGQNQFGVDIREIRGNGVGEVVENFPPESIPARRRDDDRGLIKLGQVFDDGRVRSVHGTTPSATSRSIVLDSGIESGKTRALTA